MPAKSKGSKSEWNECLSCGKIIYYKDIKIHQAECRDGCQPSHDFIEEGCFYASTVTISGNSNSNADLGIDVSFLHTEDVVFIHPSVMKICGLHIGKPCILNGTEVKIAWPCSSLPATSVGLHEKFVKETNIVKKPSTVETLTDSPQIASRVVLLSQTDGQDDEKFIEYIKKKLVGKYLVEKSVIPIRYFGQQKQFNIVSIEVLSNVEVKCSIRNDDVNELSRGLDNIQISQLDTSLSDTSLAESIKDETIDSTCDSPEKLTSTPQKEDAILKPDNFRTPTIVRTNKNVSSGLTFYLVTDQTTVSIQNSLNSTSESNQEPKNRVTLDSIGGLKSQIKLLRDLITLPFQSPDLFRSYGLQVPKGILLFGPPGVGKSMLMEAICNEVSAHIIRVQNSEIWSKFYGETETRLRNIFKEADNRAPSIIVLDDFDSLCPRRDSTPNELEKRIVTTMLSLMDVINNVTINHLTIVLAATCNLDKIDPALRRPGRFDKEIEIGVPTAAERHDILKKLLLKMNHDLSEEEIRKIADITHGFVGADLDALIKEAQLEVFKKSENSSSQGMIHNSDIQSALAIVKPTAMREVQLEVPKVLWSDIGGQDEIKLKLRQAIEWPLKHPEAFVRMGIKPPKGILLYGPPGCSKTMIAKALATESGLNFIAVKGPELFNKWVGESERAVREVFRKARGAAPSVIFFDEIDALAIERGSSSGSSNVADRVLTQLLTEIDGIEVLQDVTIVAATNRPDMIDKALMRPGRIDRILYVPLPDARTRREILKIKLSTMPIASDINIEELVEKTEDYSGAEITALCHEAAMYSLQENLSNQSIEPRHFEEALATVIPRINQKMKEFYETYSHQTGIHSL